MVDPFTWIPTLGSRHAVSGRSRFVVTTVPLPSGKETTLADPHVEHSRSETDTNFLGDSNLRGWCVSCKSQLELQAGLNYTMVRVHKQYKGARCQVTGNGRRTTLTPATDIFLSRDLCVSVVSLFSRNDLTCADRSVYMETQKSLKGRSP